MITEKELELFEKNIQDKGYRLTEGKKILTEMIMYIKDTTNSVRRNIDDCSDYDRSDYGAWDKG